MNQALGYIFVGAGCGAAGAFISYKITRRKDMVDICKIADTFAQMQVNEYKESIGKSNKHLKEENESLKKELDELLEGTSTEDLTKSHSSIGEEYRTSAPDTFDYTQAYNKKDIEEVMAEMSHPEDDDEEPEFLDDEERESYLENERINSEDAADKMLHDGPYVIDLNDYAEDKDHYDKEALYLYSDGVLAFENDEEIENVEDLVGDLLYNAAPNQTVYIRNDRRKQDYEVNCVEMSFTEATDGIGGPDWADDLEE